ncbi:hypothetical protein BC828DRAFT_282648 [Blastocladiella britannica]|nr:hypothetical protein BC828DRAFT_282648 [Blastocladiella britannica]
MGYGRHRHADPPPAPVSPDRFVAAHSEAPPPSHHHLAAPPMDSGSVRRRQSMVSTPIPGEYPASPTRQQQQQRMTGPFLAAGDHASKPPPPARPPRTSATLRGNPRGSLRHHLATTNAGARHTIHTSSSQSKRQHVATAFQATANTTANLQETAPVSLVSMVSAISFAPTDSTVSHIGPSFYRDKPTKNGRTVTADDGTFEQDSDLPPTPAPIRSFSSIPHEHGDDYHQRGPHRDTPPDQRGSMRRTAPVPRIIVTRASRTGDDDSSASGMPQPTPYGSHSQLPQQQQRQPVIPMPQPTPYMGVAPSTTFGAGSRPQSQQQQQQHYRLRDEQQRLHQATTTTTVTKTEEYYRQQQLQQQQLQQQQQQQHLSPPRIAQVVPSSLTVEADLAASQPMSSAVFASAPTSPVRLANTVPPPRPPRPAMSPPHSPTHSPPSPYGIGSPRIPAQLSPVRPAVISSLGQDTSYAVAGETVTVNTTQQHHTHQHTQHTQHATYDQERRKDRVHDWLLGGSADVVTVLQTPTPTPVIFVSSPPRRSSLAASPAHRTQATDSRYAAISQPPMATSTTAATAGSSSYHYEQQQQQQQLAETQYHTNATGGTSSYLPTRMVDASTKLQRFGSRLRERVVASFASAEAGDTSRRAALDTASDAAGSFDPMMPTPSPSRHATQQQHQQQHDTRIRIDDVVVNRTHVHDEHVHRVHIHEDEQQHRAAAAGGGWRPHAEAHSTTAVAGQYGAQQYLQGGITSYHAVGQNIEHGRNHQFLHQDSNGTLVGGAGQNQHYGDGGSHDWKSPIGRPASIISLAFTGWWTQIRRTLLLLNLLRSIVTTLLALYTTLTTLPQLLQPFDAAGFYIASVVFAVLDLTVAVIRALPRKWILTRGCCPEGGIFAVPRSWLAGDYANVQTLSIWGLVAGMDLLLGIIPLLANTILKLYHLRLIEISESPNVSLVVPVSKDGLTSTVTSLAAPAAQLVIFIVSLYITIAGHAVMIGQTLIERKRAYRLAFLVLLKAALLCFDLTVIGIIFYQMLLLKGPDLFDLSNDVPMRLMISIFVLAPIANMASNAAINFWLHYMHIRMVLQGRVFVLDHASQSPPGSTVVSSTDSNHQSMIVPTRWDQHRGRLVVDYHSYPFSIVDDEHLLERRDHFYHVAVIIRRPCPYTNTNGPAGGFWRRKCCSNHWLIGLCGRQRIFTTIQRFQLGIGGISLGVNRIWIWLCLGIWVGSRNRRIELRLDK